MLSKTASILPNPIRRYIDASGATEWVPLTPKEEFSDALRYGITTLLKYESKQDLGDYLEFGVSRGTSMVCTHHVLAAEQLDHIRKIGFDSFEGLPDESVGQGWHPGAFWSTVSATQAYIEEQGVPKESVTLVKGWFDDTLNAETKQQFSLKKASVIMVDCDIYSASKQVLMFCGPLIQGAAVILFDDWGGRAAKKKIGQKEAFEEFLEAFPNLVVAERLPGYKPASRLFLVKQRDAA